MTTAGRQQQLVAHYRQQLLNREAKTVHALEAAYAHVMTVIQPALDRLYDQMVEEMAGGEQIPATWLYEAQRLETIKKLVSGQIDNFGALSMRQVLDLQRFAVHLGQEAAQQLLQATVPPGISYMFGLPDPGAIAAMVGATQAGTPLNDLFRSFGENAAQQIGKELIAGVSLGRNPRKVAARIQAVLNDEARTRALVIARDQMIKAYRGAAFENYRANSDIMRGWIWVCALQPRSCAACVAMHGTHHSLDEELQDHVCGRCAPAPETKDWSDILSDLGIDTSNIPDTRPTFQSGENWLSEQDESTQRQILGAKYDGWAKNDFSLSDVVSYQHDPDWGRSIKEKPLKALVKT